MEWKLVPVEVTPEMLDAVSWPGIANVTYSAMIEAAPNPPALTDERIIELWKDSLIDCSQTDALSLARAIEREILGGGE